MSTVLCSLLYVVEKYLVVTVVVFTANDALD